MGLSDHAILRLAGGIVLILYSVAMASLYRIPLIRVEPGRATNVVDLISVEGTPSHRPEGQLLFLTVSLSERLTPFQALLARFDDEVELVPEQDYTGNLSREELTRVNLAVMQESELVAIKVALDHLGYDVKMIGGGALITDVFPDMPAGAHLRPGDLVIEVDGKPVTFRRDVAGGVQAHPPGENVAITVERDGKRQVFDVGTVKGARGAAQIGVQLRDTFEFEFPIEVDINTGQVGGPSAGLAFALAIIDDLTEGELTGGHRVAVTGEIDADGKVGVVGGVEQKAVAARKAGAQLMLVPDGEDEAARRVAGRRMQVVAVKTLGDALSALAALGGNALALPTSPPA
ncbi:MAG: PDZ domain-containing protein [Actinobacteria bacterium]|nr:PDZ domain-containing protein [Actinomycetota bacterium]